MARRSVRYAVVDAFTDTPFKGNPAAVCLLEEEAGVDDNWMQNVAKEFNLSQTAFLVPSAASVAVSEVSAFSYPRFRLRWFTPVEEVKLCGHATLASAHFLFTSGLVKSEIIEFDTAFGILTTKKVHEFRKLDSAEPYPNGNGESFSIELDFPLVQVVDCVSEEIPSFPETLKDLPIVDVHKTSFGDLLVELTSGKELADVKPNLVELKRCAGRGVIMTAPAPPGTGFDFFSRFFCPKLEINEDPVCGSAHCALAPYWSRKLGKLNLIAYQASPRSGILDLQVDEGRNRVLMRGKAVTTMAGFLMV
ncbi:uncharacterized protein LOC110024834 [Phalaenopsis equestris]|uniref:uncharacterized protein LOC110024834 n=1 Tax=Phalaenopsis equestris TaxID=78828 RepID=UPI0009E47537|nr:uncharacterized protein LOC110024834 [Phalaenopsis equestris]